MSRPLLVLVSGPPGAGKTTIARELSTRLHLPLIAKDDIKETLFDSLGWSDLAWSRKLGAATWEILWTLMERFMSAGASAIFESNFYPDDQRERLLELRERWGFVPFEVHCTAEPETLARRSNQRERHPGHHWSSGVTAELAATWRDANSALELSEAVVRVDSTGRKPVDLDGILAELREAASGL